MADATMYDPKNVAGITTLYVTPTKESPIYLKAYPASIAGVDTIVGGTGYTAATGVATTGGDGQGCTVNTTVSGGAVSAVAINKHGTGYKDNDVLTITGGGGNATFAVNVVDGQEDVELSPHQNTSAAGTLSTSTW